MQAVHKQKTEPSPQPSIPGEILAAIPTHCILPNPYQPRRNFDDEALRQLCDSIREFGLIQPICVRRVSDAYYELIAGERRLRACRRLGMKRIAAIIVPANGQESALAALIENLQREDLNCFEEALGYAHLLKEHGMTQDELAMRLGKSQATIANKLRLLKLPKSVRDLMQQSDLSERHARALLKVNGEQDQLELVRQFIDKKMTVHTAEAAVERLLQKKYALSQLKAEESVPRIRRAMRDPRLLLNTLRKVTEEMRLVGAQVNYSENPKTDGWEVCIYISNSRRDASEIGEKLPELVSRETLGNEGIKNVSRETV